MRSRVGRIRATVLFACTVATLASAGAAWGVPPSPCASNEGVRIAPPASGAYHFGYFSPTPNERTVTRDSIDEFETLAGRPVAGVVFSDPWGTRGKLTIGFPTRKVRTIWRHGAVPVVRFTPWTRMVQGRRDPIISMQRIINGRFDAALLRWFRAAAATEIPMMIDVGVEVNGDWFPWNGRYNGGGVRDRYGDPSYPDGPERYRDAYRHLVRLARRPDVDADNLTWTFHVDAGGWPDRWWNQPRWYYPGDRYVDWITVSVYGEQVPSGRPERWTSFTDQLGDPDDPDSPYARIRAISEARPLGLIEVGVTEDPDAGDKGAWIAEAFAAVRDGTYDFDLVSWWHERWRNGSGKISNLRIDSSPGALAAYRDAVADPFFGARLRFVCG
ncbi:MAG: beta-mannanase [Actinomycetota bacterium]|nr:MAG: beta-mannanase [Actinomycetota bacterium]